MLAYLQKGRQMVTNFLRPKKKLGWISFVFLSVLLLAVVLSLTPVVHAADIWDTVANMISRFSLMIATFFMKLTIFCLTFIIQIAAYNGYLDSTAVNYGWVMVRDIANMFFVVVLLLIAFGTILGLDQYEWKKMMVKFVMAAILVNFSRLICGVIIDIGQVVMVTFINGVAATAGGNLINMFNLGDIMSLTGQQEVNGSEVLMASVASAGFAAMALGIMAVFLIMLMGRMITLWILIVLSPLAFVLSVVPQTQKYASDWWSQFGNNVVVGPVIAFFLWLAFVTVGNGTINSEISANSQTDMKIQENSTEDVGAQSAGISSAMSWDKMANFAIAIGMLLVGAKTAQQLGTAGGNMMSKATDFAKKATMVASGVAAGKWMYDKGVKPAAKWTAMNVPLVGGKVWKRRGRAIAGTAVSGWEILGKKRDSKAADWEKKAFEAKGAKGLLTKVQYGLGASIIMSQKKAEKTADAYKDVAENLSTWHEKNISSSGTWIGQQKTITGALAEEAKTFSQTKGKSKAYGAREEMMEGKRKFAFGGVFSESFNVMEKSIRDEMGRTRETEGKYSLQQEKAAEARERRFLDLKIKLDKGDSEDKVFVNKEGKRDVKLEGDYGRWLGLLEGRARLAQEKREEVEKKKEIAEAKVKDQMLTDRGLPPQFEQAVRAAHQEEIEKRMGSMTYRELTKTTALIAKQIQGEIAKGSNADRGKLRLLLENQAAALALNAKRGSEFFEQAMQEACNTIGFRDTVKADDFKGMQRKVLSVLTGQVVSEENMGSADSDLREKFGENYNLIMRNLNESFKKAAADGSVNAAGLFYDKDMDAQGRVQYRLSNTNKEAEDMRSYYAQEVLPSKVTSLLDMTAKTGDGKFADFSGNEAAINHLISSFGNMTVSTKLHNRLIDELNGYVDGSGRVNEDVKNSFAKFFKKFIETKRESAGALLYRMPQAFVDALAADPVIDGSEEIKGVLQEMRGKMKKNVKKTEAVVRELETEADNESEQ